MIGNEGNLYLENGTRHNPCNGRSSTLTYVDPGTCNDVSSAFPICLLAEALVCINISCYETRIPQHHQNLTWIRYPWSIMPLTLLWTDVCIPTTFSQFASCGKPISFWGIAMLWNSFLATYNHNPCEANIAGHSSKICDHWICGFSSSERIDIYKFSSEERILLST